MEIGNNNTCHGHSHTARGSRQSLWWDSHDAPPDLSKAISTTLYHDYDASHE